MNLERYLLDFCYSHFSKFNDFNIPINIIYERSKSDKVPKEELDEIIIRLSKIKLIKLFNENDPKTISISLNGILFFENKYIQEDKTYTILTLKLLEFLDKLEKNIISLPRNYITLMHFLKNLKIELTDKMKQIVYWLIFNIQNSLIKSNTIGYLSKDNPNYNFNTNMIYFPQIKGPFLNEEGKKFLNENLNLIINFTPDITKIYDMLRTGESETVEFKTTFRWDIKENICSKELSLMVIETICAFSNSRGGIILIGIEDNGNIYGLQDDFKHCFQKSKDKFQIEVPQKIREEIGSSVIYKIDIKQLEQKEICIIEVQPSISPIFLKNGAFLIRKGTSNHRLSPKETHEYIINHFSEDQLTEYRESPMREIKIDTELIDFYSDLILKGEISDNNIIKAFETLQNEINLIFSIENVNENIIKSVEQLINACMKLLKHNNYRIKHLSLFFLATFVRINDTRKIVYDNCLDDLIQLYESGTTENDLIFILNAFGYFKDIWTLIISAIKKDNIELLKKFHRYLNFNTIKKNRFEIIKNLNLVIDNLDPVNNTELIDVINNIKRKLERKV